MGDREKNPNWNPRMRNNGNPHSRGDKREAGRVGFGRDNVIPSQGGLFHRLGFLEQNINWARLFGPTQYYLIMVFWINLAPVSQP
jgi:hypothetical protein